MRSCPSIWFCNNLASYRHAARTLTEYAEQLVEDCYSHEIRTIPEFIQYHIDYEGIAHDMELNVGIFTIDCDGRVHVFDSNCQSQVLAAGDLAAGTPAGPFRAITARLSGAVAQSQLSPT